MTATITNLKPNQVFVFGSNKAGMHGGGAARQAYEKFGAKMGVDEGMTGRSYAFPTLTKDFQKVTKKQLKSSVMSLYVTAITHPEKEFLLTKVGCGIAGFDEDYIKSLFNVPPANIVLPDDWINEK